MEHVSCNLCGRDETVLRFPGTLTPGSVPHDVNAFRCTSPGYGRHFDIVQCRRCGLVYTNPRPDSGQILGSYETVEDPLYLEERDGRELTFERHLLPIERLHPPPGRLLDVGAYGGVFVELARRRGWDAWGLEPGRWAVENARSRGLNMIEGTLARSGIEDGTFDVVTLWDVVEHLADPSTELEQAFRVLRSGGLLVVHTMDIDSPFARALGRRWPWLMEMHLYYFSRTTLAATLERAGFELVRAETQGRYLRIGYLATRIGGLSPLLGRAIGGAIGALKLRHVPVAVNFGDLFTVYAVKP